MPLLVHTVVAWISGLTLAALAFGDATRLAITQSAMAQTGVAQAATMHATVPWWNLAAGGVALIGLLGGALRLTGRATPLSALALVTAAGMLVGRASATQRATCASLLAQSASLQIVLDERVAPQSRATGQTLGDGDPTLHSAIDRCRIAATIRVRSGTAPAGAIATLTITETTRTTARGIRVTGDINDTGRRDHLRQWRGRIGEHIDRLYGQHAPLVRALLIADQHAIAPDIRDRFADAGLVHMLSISGLHVAIIAEALLTLAVACRIPKRTAQPLALLAVTLYVLMLGAPPPAVRSAVMLATVTFTDLLQRPVHPWTALALGAVVPTLDPAVVVDLGWQLSVGGMASLVAARALLRRLRTVEISSVEQRVARAVLRRLRELHGWRATLFREMATGVIATLVTAPLVAWTFGRVSIIAPLSNLVAGPVVAVLQPAMFLSILLIPWSAAASLVADGSVIPLRALDVVARLTARVPHASLHIAPTLVGATLAGLASIAFVRATAARRWTPWLVAATGALSCATWLPRLTRGTGALELHLLDVGQGDAIALRTPKGRWVLVDAGRVWDGGDAGRRVVVPYVQRRGGDVAAFVMSHAHDDHMGGAASVAHALHPRRWWEPAFVSPNPHYRALLEVLQRAQLTWQRVHPHDTMSLDGVQFTVLAPDSVWTAAQHDANETSVVLRVAYGEVAFLLTGDAEAAEEAWLLAHADPHELRADVLKLGHHGSKTSSTAPFIDAVRPSLGLVSVGEDNRYGHPSPEVLGAFAERGVPLLRTDRDGVVVIATNGHQIRVESGGDSWQLLRAVAR